MNDRTSKYLEGESFSKIKTRLRSTLSRNGFGSHAEDCAQEYALAILQGKSQRQTTDQFVIDYLRKRFGSARTPGFAQRKNRENADSYEQGNYDRSIGSRDGMPLDDRLDLRRMGTFLDGRDQEIFRKRFIEGMNEAEIGNQFGFSESWVCQRLKGIQSRIRERIAQAGSLSEREGRRKMVEILFGTWTRMEFEETQRVALKESGEMGRLDGARFEEWIA